MILSDLQRELTLRMKGAGFPHAAFEVRQIFQQALNLDPAQMITYDSREITPEEEALVRQWTSARLNGEPLAYLSGRKGFFKHEFLVERGVLIPRPETEIVVEHALKRSNPQRIADYGCGSGCIGLSLAVEFPRAHLWSVDSAHEAIAVTLKNAEKLNIADRVQVILSSIEAWSPPVAFDLIVANPPYIAEGDTRVEENVRKFEPHAALYSGPDGLAALRGWSLHAFRNLLPGGIFVSEFGAGQTQAVREIMMKSGFQEIELLRDLAGHDRVVSGRKP